MRYSQINANSYRYSTHMIGHPSLENDKYLFVEMLPIGVSDSKKENLNDPEGVGNFVSSCWRKHLCQFWTSPTSWVDTYLTCCRWDFQRWIILSFLTILIEWYVWEVWIVLGCGENGPAKKQISEREVLIYPYQNPLGTYLFTGAMRIKKLCAAPKNRPK